MTVKISMNVKQFQEQLQATQAQLMKATRPAAQAGAQLIYDFARLPPPMGAPVSEKPHKFHIEGRVYGPFAPGTLRDSVYQVFSTSMSYRDVSVYEISFNKQEAPYGFTVTRGTSKTPANNFIARAVLGTRAKVRAAIKERYIAAFTTL